MDLRNIFNTEDVHIQFPILAMLFNIVAKPGTNGVVEPLDLHIGWWMLRCRENVFDPQDLVDVLEEP